MIDKIYSHFSAPLIQWLTPAPAQNLPAPHPGPDPGLLVGEPLLGPGLVDLGGKVIGTDFMAFYTAGNFYLSDRMNDLYNFREPVRFSKKSDCAG